MAHLIRQEAEELADELLAMAHSEAERIREATKHVRRVVRTPESEEMHERVQEMLREKFIENLMKMEKK